MSFKQLSNRIICLEDMKEQQNLLKPVEIEGWSSWRKFDHQFMTSSLKLFARRILFCSSRSVIFVCQWRQSSQ
jgi:hypothetical protein